MKNILSEGNFPEETQPHIPQQVSKIKCNKYHVRAKFNYGSLDLFQSKIKRTYFHSFKINAGIYQFYRGIGLKPLKVLKNMKYIQSVVVMDVLSIRDQTSRDVCEMVRRLNRTKSVNMHFGSMYKWNLNSVLLHIKRLTTSLKSNLTKLQIQITFVFEPDRTAWKVLHIFMDMVKSLNKLKSLSFVIEKEPRLTIDALQNYNLISLASSQEVKIYQRKFQKIARTIEDFHLKYFIPDIAGISCFTEDFTFLKSLKCLEVVSLNRKDSERILEAISKKQTLSSLIVYYHLNFKSLFSLLLIAKNIKAIAIRCSLFDDFWDENLLNSMKGIDFKLTCLHLDFPLEIKTIQHIQFISNFLGIFKNLRDLKIYIHCDMVDLNLSSITSAINSLQNLKTLTLGFSLSMVDSLSSIFSPMPNIINLEKFTFVLKVSATRSQGTDALNEFILQNKSLRKLEIFWQGLDLISLRQLTKCIRVFSGMELFNLSYLAKTVDHNKIHEQILVEIEKALKEITNIKKVMIHTCCNFREHINCETIGMNLKRKLEGYTNIKQFVFKNGFEIQTPFYNDSLSQKICI